MLDPVAIGFTAHMPPSAPPRRRLALPVLTVVLGAMGTLALVLAIGLGASSIRFADAAAASTAGPTPTRTPGIVPATSAPSAAGATEARSAVAVSERVDPAWVSRVARAANISERALAAYVGAALAVADANPRCGLGWNTLAAIGHVETEHGTMGGARIRDDGVTIPIIIGVPLNGEGVDAIPDTDGGLIDGDNTWDRAVGPMQFIPGTWAQHAQDANGDGITDIHQIDDAAMTAAVYLCTAGGDLANPRTGSPRSTPTTHPSSKTTGSQRPPITTRRSGSRTPARFRSSVVRPSKTSARFARDAPLGAAADVKPATAHRFPITFTRDRSASTGYNRLQRTVCFPVNTRESTSSRDNR